MGDTPAARLGEITFADGATTEGMIVVDELVSMGELAFADKVEGDIAKVVITNCLGPTCVCVICAGEDMIPL